MFSFFRLVVCASLWLIIDARCETAECAACFNTTTACPLSLLKMQPQFPLSGSNNEEDAKNICCQERQSLFYAVTRNCVIDSCSVCPPKIRTLSERKEVTGPLVSLGTASDVVVNLECGWAVDGIDNIQQEPPKWNSTAIGSTSGIRLLQDDTVEITPVYLANTITLECMIVFLGKPVPTQIQIVKNEGLFFTKALQNVPLNSDLECPVPELPENNVTWHNAVDNVMLASNRAPSAGTYYCKVEQSNRGTYISGSVVVYQEPPVPNEQSVHNGSTNEILAAPGDNVLLPLGCDSPGAELLFNGQPFSIPNNNLTNVTSDNSGFYQCREGGTSAGNRITSTYVNVVTMNLSANHTSAQGRTMHLTCTLEHPVPEKSLKWFKNSIEINEGGRLSLTYDRSNGVSTTTLTVRDLNGDDCGTYKCEADIYTQYQTARPVSQTVEVGAPPGAPQSIQIGKPTGNSAPVTWEGPVNDDSVDITAYYIQWWKTVDGMATAKHLEVPVSSGEMSHTIEDLEAFTEYSVQIRASTTMCNGIFSDVQNFTTEQEAPSNPPKDLTARPIHDSIVELQWKVPDEPHNGIISNYRITYHKTGASNEKSTVTSTSTTFEVGMLDADTEYTFSVEAGTAGGYGLSSPAVSVTTLSQVEPRGRATPKLMKTLSYTVKVEFEELQTSSGSFSHYWIVAVKLPNSRCSLGDSDHPNDMFPHEDNFSQPGNILDSGAYVAAEIDAAKLEFPLEFVFGDSNHPDDDGNYDNVRLEQKSCYTFFLRGFLDIPPATSAKRDISMRRYRYYVTSQFMPPVTTLSETSWLQIRFSPVPSCAKWRDGATLRRYETLERLASRINEECNNCGFNRSRFPDSFFSCDKPMEDSEESVVLKAEVNETNGFSAQDAVRVISDWKDGSPSITVDGSSFTICSSCVTQIESRNSEDCPPCSNSIDYTITIIGVSVGTFVILVVLAVIIIIVIVVIRCKSMKQKCDYDTNERNRPQEEGTHVTPVIIANPPENNYPPVDFDGKYNDFRPQVVGGSATDLPTEYIPHAFLHPVHHSSTASLSSAGNGTPAPYAMMPIYPHPYGVRLPPVGMMPVKDIPVSHHQLANHRRTKSGDSFGMGNLGTTPSHSRQPSDVTVPAESRRFNEYVYYPYPYYHHYYPPHYYHSSGYASPSSHRMVSERELEKRHLAGSGYSTPYLPQRPHTADLLEAEVPRGQSPMLYHKLQESVVSQPPMNGEQPVVHPFLRRGLKVQAGFFSTSHLPSKPIEGDHTMERFLNAQLQGSQQGLSDQHRDSNHEEVPSSDSKSESKTNVSNLSLSNKLPGSSTNIESEVL